MNALPTTPELRVDLSAVTANYLQLKSRLEGAECGAVVKADAYGLGMSRIAGALAGAGCTHFFVATLEEGIALREVLYNEEIFVFHGIGPGEAGKFLSYSLAPVINDLAQLERWEQAAGGLPKTRAALHMDTGMCRLGFTPEEFERLADDPQRFLRAGITLLMSHLACADDPQHAKNAEQLARFRDIRARFSHLPASLANSSGIFLGPDYHFDMVRPGASLYGISPTPGAANPMRQVATLTAPILQIRTLEGNETVGYEASFQGGSGTRIATLALGYADGYFRSLSNRGRAFINGRAVPVAGVVSMDMVTLDVTSIPEDALRPGMRVELIGPHQPVDAFAQAAGTIGYEVFTRLGPRVKRVYATEEENAAAISDYF